MPKRSMTKQEFERLAGYEISDTDYRNIIEPMYMATPLNKREFIQCINKKRFGPSTEDELIAAMKKEACPLWTNFLGNQMGLQVKMLF